MYPSAGLCGRPLFPGAVPLVDPKYRCDCNRLYARIARIHYAGMVSDLDASV